MEDNETKKPIVYVNATAHLDTVWNWTLEDTVKRHLVRTIEENFYLFERYPNYKFNFEGAYRYDLIKEYYPDDYEKIREYIRDGKWFVTGSAWENGDVITPSAEALMRNILYGNRYFKEEFGKVSNDIYLPDCFGFAYTLPSIMNHMGLTSFSSAKLIWNTGNKVPFEVGIWKGVGGSEVVACLDPGQYVTKVHEMWSKREDLYEHIMNLPIHKTFKYYGVGDEGGAPDEPSAKFMNDSAGDKDGKVEVISAYAGQITDELTPEERAALPVYDGELLMTTHGVGSYTSVAPTKRFNRKNELAADFSERSNVFAAWLGIKDYPKEKLTDAWKMVIRHQFHDDITGTSLQRVYKESFTDYITAMNKFVHELATAQENIADNIDTSSLSNGIPVVVFNGITADRKDIVTAEIHYGKAGKEVPQYIKVYNYEGKETVSQILERNGDILKIAFGAEILSDGYSTYSVVSSDKPCDMNTGLSVSEKHIENNNYKVTVDDNGNISQIYDKVNNKTLLNEPIRYEILDNNYTHYGAWEILYDDVIKAPRHIVGGIPTVKVIENGPVKVSLEVTRKDAISTYTQIISLNADSEYVNVENKVNWLEQSAFLKVAFPMAVYNDKATYDMSLGTIDRGNNEEMKYEVPVHQWANIKDKDSGYGITIMNDCKYAMDKPENNILRLTAIHTPQNKFLDGTRQDMQDFGENRFAYAIMGKQGSWKESYSAIKAAAYNQPLTAVQTTAHRGVLPNEFSFVAVNDKRVSVKAVKFAEDTDEIIIRVHETFGEKAENVKLQFAGGIESAREVNGFEEEISDAAVEEGILIFSIDPYKPKTFAIKPSVCTASLIKKEYETIAIEGNVLISSNNSNRGEYGFTENNVTVPAEIFSAEFVTGGVPFKLGTDKDGLHTGVISDGRKIALPSNSNKVYIIAASLNDDKEAVFDIAGTSKKRNIQGFDSYIGGWDQYGSNNYGYIKHDIVAYSASHTHDISGDKVYGKFLLYKYEIDISDIKGKEDMCITLPNDSDILVAAITVLSAGQSYSNFSSKIIDRKEKKTVRTLTVNDGHGGGEYVAGNPVSVIYSGEKNGEVIWKSSDGAEYSGMALQMTMPDYDLILTPYIKEYGQNVAAGAYTVADGEVETDISSNSVDANKDTKWRNLTVKSSWLILDMRDRKTFDTIVIKHAGYGKEASMLNTVNFKIQVFSNDEWKDVSCVKDNRLAVTTHNFSTVSSRYIRLIVERPTLSESDKFTRIYSIEAYNESKIELPAYQVKENELTPFDIIDGGNGGTIIFKGNVKSGQCIDLEDKVLINKWMVGNMSQAELFLSNDGEKYESADSALKKKLDNIQRVIKGKEASYCKIAGTLINENEECELTVIGKSLSLELKNKWQAKRAGTRNNYASKNEDGTMFLPKDEKGGGHDMFGLGVKLNAGTIKLYMCIKISEDELGNASDDLKLFRFNPILPGGDVSGPIITVGDYKAAKENEEGYKILSTEFLLAANGEIEGRISSERNLDMLVSEFGVYGV